MLTIAKRAVLWQKKLANRPGTLAKTLRPLMAAGVNLQVVMSYVIPGDRQHAVVEVYPVIGSKAERAAREVGLAPASHVGCLLIQGKDRPGLGHNIADALAASQINISFLIAQVIDGQYVGVCGFDNNRDADRAAPIIRQIGFAAKHKVSQVKQQAAKPARASSGTKKAASKKVASKKTASKKVASKKVAAKSSPARTIGKATSKKVLTKATKTISPSKKTSTVKKGKKK